MEKAIQEQRVPVVYYQTDGKTFGEIVRDTIRLMYKHVLVDGVTAASIIGISYSTFRRWCDYGLIKGTGTPIKFCLPDILFCDKAEMQRKYRLLNK